MNRCHEVAIAHPCRFGFETMHPRFRSLSGDRKVSIIVTVNSGYE